MNCDVDDVLSLGGALFLLGVLAILVTYLIVSARAEKACLKLGYRETSLSWTLEPYCVRRVNQTDEVVPLSDARRLP